jgi:hypothetical protein
MDTPTDEELAAIAAAYAILLRSAAPPPAPQPSRWRKAAREEITTSEWPPLRKS